MNIFVLAINYVLTGCVVGLCLRRGAFKLLDPAWAFIGGYFINYCIRPTLFLIDPELGSVYPGIYDEAMVRRGFGEAVIFAMVGLAAFALGVLAFAKASRKLSNALPSPSFDAIMESKSVFLIALAFLGCGWWGLHGFLSIVGWSGSLFLLLQGGQRYDFSEATFGHGAFTFAAQLSLVGWAMICAHWTVTDLPIGAGKRLIRRMTQVTWFLLTAAIWAAFGERSSLSAVLFIPVALKYTLRKKADADAGVPAIAVPVKKILLLLTAAVFLVAGPIGLLFKGVEASPAAAVSLSISAWDSFEFTVVAQNVLRVRDLALGSSYLQDVIYSWLPRALFPSKPERYGIVILQDRLAPDLLDNEGATFPPGILVEAFANFGYPGLFLIPVLIGMFVQALYFRIAQNDAYWIMLLSFLFSGLASFRSFGSFVALLIANGIVLYAALIIGRVLEFLHGPRAMHSQPLGNS